MSADNCIAILMSPKSAKNTKPEARIVYAQAIDNLLYDDGTLIDGYNPRMLVEYFGKCKALTPKEASAQAKKMEKEMSYLEYGIITMELKHPFAYYKKIAKIDQKIKEKILASKKLK